MDNTTLIINDIEEKEMFLQCQVYLAFRHEGKTMVQWAEHCNISERTAYYQVARWKAAGVFDRAEMEFRNKEEEEIRAVVDEVLRRWPDVIRHMLTIATDPKSRLAAIQAAMVLKREVVDPARETKRDEGNPEKRYLSGLNEVSFDPIGIAAPNPGVPKP